MSPPRVSPTTARRVDDLEPEGAYQVLAKARQLEQKGRRVIHLEIGEPDFPTPPEIAARGVDAIRDGRTRYTPTAGLSRLREVIAEDAGRRRGIAIDMKNVVVAPGAKPLLFFPTLALVETGDEVVYPDPGFPTYESMIRIAGGVPVPVRLDERDGFALDLRSLTQRVNRRTRMIILNSPANPTGGVLREEALKSIATLAQNFDCWVLSDEIYSRLCYQQDDAPSIASLPGMSERTILVDGFSKSYSMTGWRLGYGIMPEALAEKVSLLLVHSVGCTAEFTQWAGIEALTGPQTHVERRRESYRARRDALVSGLNSIKGIHCQSPAGAFYVFPNVRSFGLSSLEIANRLLDEAGIALLPGTAFGKGGEGFLRLCYAVSEEEIATAIDVMRKWFSQL